MASAWSRETAWAAFAARQALIGSVTWTPDRHGLGLRQRQGASTPSRPTRKNLTQPARDWSAQGNARGAFQNAASMVEGEYRCDYAYHAQMEPLNAVASVAPGGDAVEIWAGTQSQTTATEAPAKFLGISRDKVKLHDLLMGGGFGRRGNRDVDFIIDAVMLSKEVGVRSRRCGRARMTCTTAGSGRCRRITCAPASMPRASSRPGITVWRRTGSRRSWIRFASSRAAAGTAW